LQKQNFNRKETQRKQRIGVAVEFYAAITRAGASFEIASGNAKSPNLAEPGPKVPTEKFSHAKTPRRKGRTRSINQAGEKRLTPAI
jgi:hypothetical protein